jgi:hypothetical protein
MTDRSPERDNIGSQVSAVARTLGAHKERARQNITPESGDAVVSRMKEAVTSAPQGR